MAWSYLLSVRGSSGLGPRVLMYANGAEVNVGDLVLPQQLLAGTSTGTPGDGTCISAYHVVVAGTLGAEPGSNWPAAAEDTFPTSGTVTFRSKNLYHYDPSAATNGTGSQSSPAKLASSASAANGRVVVIRQGTTATETTGFGASGSSANSTYGWILTYNTGIDSGPTTVGTLGIGNCQWVVVDGIRAVGSGTSNGFSYMQGSGSAASNVFFRNCQALGVRNSSDGNNNGFMITSSSSTDLSITSLYFDDCVANDCGGYGFGLESVNTAQNASSPVLFTNCSASGNGLQKAAWNFGGYARFGYSATGWTRVGGVGTFIYSRADATQVRRVADHGGSNFRHLTENTGTPTAPTTNEWGWSAGTLYINLGVDTGTGLSGRGIWWSHNFCDGVTFSNCVSDGAVSSGGFDGSGFGCDTLTSGWVFRNCISRNNEGEGFVSNIAASATFENCIAENNGAVTGQSGFSVNNAVTATVKHCIATGSNQAGLSSTNPNGTIVAKNNIFASNGTYGMVASGTFTETNNCVYGNTSGTISGASLSGTDVTVDPQLRSDYLSQNSALWTAGASLGGTDFYGRVFNGTIGAVQYGSLTGIALTGVPGSRYGTLFSGKEFVRGQGPFTGPGAIGGLPRTRSATFTGKSESSIKAAGPFTRQSVTALSRPPLGSFSGKSTAVNITVDIGNTPAITFTELAPSILSDVVVVIGAGVTKTFTVLSITVEQGLGNLLSIGNVPALAFTEIAPQIEIDVAGDNYINIENVASITFTGLAPSIQFTNNVDIGNVQALTFSALEPFVEVDGLVPPVLSRSDAYVIWDQIDVDGYSPRQILRIMAAAVAGEGVYDSSGNLVGYLSVDGSRLRLSKPPGDRRTGVSVVDAT